MILTLLVVTFVTAAAVSFGVSIGQELKHGRAPRGGDAGRSA